MNVIVILCDTLRRDHCGAYTGGKPLNQCWSEEAPEWSVPTPNMERLAQRGTVFENCWCGSTPCMPARRDIHTGRLEFLERGWGPLEEGDADLPRQVSGPPNTSITAIREQGRSVSYLVSDHFHLWEQGSGNYHMGYSGFQFIRGIESDGLYTDPIEPGRDFTCPESAARGKCERHWRNMHFDRHEEADWTCARTFRTAADWLRRNRDHQDFFLHIDCFPPHEPLDPPEEILKLFWPDGYGNPEDNADNWPYAKWAEAGLTERQMNFTRARYAANVVLVDRWLGHLLDTMDDLDLWKETLVIFTTDHGTYNGDHGRVGKLQTHNHDAVAHIPFIACHPKYGHGERRSQLVQLVDIYPMVLAATGSRFPAAPLHGIDLLPVIQDPGAPTRDYAVAGMFGGSMTITDGRWVLHQPPGPDNQPLNWYGYHLARFIPYPLGDFADGCRPVGNHQSYMSGPLWLSDRQADPNELRNMAASHPGEVARLQEALRHELQRLEAPPEQLLRLDLSRRETSDPHASCCPA